MGVYLLGGMEEVLRLALIRRGVMRIIWSLHDDFLNILVLDIDANGVVQVHPRHLSSIFQTFGFIVDLHR